MAAVHAGASMIDSTIPALSDGSESRDRLRGCTRLPACRGVTKPRVGWVHNTNDWPWSAAGPDSPQGS